MSRQLPPDCLHYIFEFLEKDKVTLHSCLLVNRLWCEVSVRILWRNNDEYSSHVFCLPNESKTLLSIPTSKPPLFNYATFYKVLQIGPWKSLETQEIFKMFMNQTSLKKLSYNNRSNKFPNLTQFPRARDCLTRLSKLSCRSNINSEFFYQLSQICHNIQSVTIILENEISNGLKHLISSQNNLKSLKSITEPNYSTTENWADIVPLPLLMRCSNTLINLKMKVVAQPRIFDFKELRYVTFPQIQILKFQGGCPDSENFIKFLEINGKNLIEFYATYCHESINLAVAKFCPNLKSLYTYLRNNDSLKIIFQSCEKLEKIGIRSDYYITGKQILTIVAKHSPKNFQELELYHPVRPKNLESFFVSWKDRISQRPLSFIGYKRFWSLDKEDENTKIIEKYKKLGTIKKFEVVAINH